MSSTISRRQFLRGTFRATSPDLRPPWALAEDAFVDTCTRCDACLRACPQGVVRAGEGGYPMVDFVAGECTFCAACVDACLPRALRDAHARPWRAVATVGANCLALRGVHCDVCRDPCAVRAIRFQSTPGRVSSPAINAAVCSGCGACVASCPAQALKVMPVRAGATYQVL
jgi:ferredoxin-type protein NapF